jgi:DNA polymerase bacteriophage-type
MPVALPRLKPKYWHAPFQIGGDISKLDELDILGIDFETYFDKDYSLTKLTTSEYIADPRFEARGAAIKQRGKKSAWCPADQLPKFLKTVDWKRTALLCHHTQFDGLILALHYGVIPAYYLCTLSMGRALHLEMTRSGLDALAKFYGLRNKMPDVLMKTKGLHELPPDLYQQLALYACVDIELAEELFDLMVYRDHYPARELDLIDLTIRMYTEPTLLLTPAKAKLEAKRERDEKEALVIASGVSEQILQSSDKLAAHLESLGIDVPTKTSPKTGEETWAFSKQDEEFTELLSHPDEAVAAIVRARLRVKSTLAEKRAERLLRLSGGYRCVPIYLAYCAAHTKRWGGGDKLNFQNFPRVNPDDPLSGLLRKALVAPKGYKVVVADLGQIEARLTAWLAGQADILEAFADPDRDPYKELASMIYGVPIEEITKAQRFIGKVGTLGLGFKLGATKYQRTLRLGALGGPSVYLDDAESARHVNIYRRKNYMVVKLWRTLDGVITDMLAGREGSLKCISWGRDHIKLPSGLRLNYPQLWHYEFDDQQGQQVGYVSRGTLTRLYDGKLLENIIQALARIILTDAMLVIANVYKVALTVHDEIVAIVPDKQVKKAMAFIAKIMSQPPAWAPDLPLAVDIDFGKNYGDAKP